MKNDSVPKLEGVVSGLLNGKKYFGGDEPDVVDVFLAPMITRIDATKETVMSDLYEYYGIEEKAPSVKEYTKTIRAHPVLGPEIFKVEFA